MKKRKRILGIMVLMLIAIAVIAGSLFLRKKDKVIHLKSNMAGQSVSISIYKGENYLHDFIVNSFLTIKTPPQMAVWVEDLDGNYVETLYATKKIVYQKWDKAPSDNGSEGKIKRKEALPYWTYKKANKRIIPDEVTSATSKSNSFIDTKMSTQKEQYKIMAEINMSTDFNEFYKKEASQIDHNYSGGEYGSGQPAIVYEAMITSNKDNTYELNPVGHSSPDGSDGELYPDLSELTTAKDIVSRIIFEVHNDTD